MTQVYGYITSEIKSISYSPILFRFELTDKNDNKFNCILHTHALNFFLEAKTGSAIKVLLHKNKRGQFVVKKFFVFNSEVFV